MENSEIRRSSVENPEGLRKDGVDLEKSQLQQEKTGNSRSKTREMEDTPRKTRVKSAKKEGRKEVTGISSEDQACPELYSKILKDLESQHFVVPAEKLEDPSKCAGAAFYCELCSVKMENVEACQNHVRKKEHKKTKKAKGDFLLLSRIPAPSEHQIQALTRLLDSVFLEHGLCPVKDLSTRQEVTKDVGRTVRAMHPECSVFIYGSSFTGFGLKESDVNLDLVIPDEANVPHILLSILELLQNDDNYCDVKSEFDAKVPRILFKHVSSGLDCELSPGNVTAAKTSCLLKKYSDLDPRVRTLAVGLRYWGKVCIVDCQSEGGLPGYSLALMVIQFLQEAKPPVLPRWTPSEMIDNKNPCDFVSSNKDETGSLWYQMFRFYCVDFDIPNLVISIKDPVPLKREAKKWGHRRIAIEDPFSSKRNVASSLSSDRVYEYFFSCWKNSFQYFSSMPSDSQNKVSSSNPNISANKNENEVLQNKKQETKLDNHEEAIFEMDDLDNTTKQMQSIELSSVDGVPPKSTSQEQTGEGSPSLNAKDDSGKEEEKEITLSGCESEDVNDSRGGRDTDGDSREKGCNTNQGVNNTAVTAAQDIVYRFDDQVFRGNSRPVKTCCYCKDDGHIKEQCPELRKPTLRALPLMTPQFGAVLDYVCNTCRGDFEFEKTEVAYREKVLKNLEGYIHEIFPDARLFLFGSSKNGFGFYNSDIDICMTLEDHVKEEVDAVDVIINLAKHLKKHKDCGNVLAITTAKVPIVKFYLRSCKREADISLYNTLALENTAMLATYAKLDDRVATLGYTVKVFAKVCDIGDASKGSLSSYAYILMLLHYLQQCKPPVIPVLQTLYEDNKQPEKIVDGWNCWFCKDLKTIKRLWNQQEKNPFCAGMLWYGFLRYYTEEFDFEHDVVCCRRIKKLTKFEKMWTKHVFAIEDPFNLDHNLGAGVTRKMAHYIQSTFIKGRERFGFPRYDIPPALSQSYFFDVYFLTDGYEAPTDRNCRVCGKIGHIAKDCPHSKHNRRAEQKREEQEQKENQGGPGLSRKPFNAGPSRPRSASAPNKQGQNKNADSSRPLPATQSKNIPSHQEDNVTSLSRSQPDSQFVASSMKEGQNNKHKEGKPENASELSMPQVSHTLSETNKSAAFISQEGKVVVDPNRTQSEHPISDVSSPSSTNKIASSMKEGQNNKHKEGKPENASELSMPQVSHTLSETNKSAAFISQEGKVVVDPNRTQSEHPISDVSSPSSTNKIGEVDNKQEGNPTSMPSSRSTNSSNQTSVAASTTMQTSSSVPLAPPPGFSIPDGTSPVPDTKSTGSLHMMAVSMSPSPPVNISPADRIEGQPVILNTPPQHQPGMFSPPSGHFLGSPSPQEMWLRQQGLMMLNHHSPPVRPLVPYPLTPELQVQSQLQQWRGAPDNLTMQHAGSPVRAQQRIAEHNHPVLPQSPPNISRSVMWPVATNSPPLTSGQQFQGHQFPFPHVSSPGMPAPTIASPQHLMYPHLSHTNSPGVPAANVGSPQRMTQGSSHTVPESPQQILQQLPFPHSPGMPPLVQRQQQPVLHQEGLAQSAFGTHMTGQQFIDLIRVAEDESKKSENILPTKLSSDEFEPKELKPIAPKDLKKVAETPEEHQLLSKLSKVKSLWEGNSSAGLENSRPSPVPIETGHVMYQEEHGVLHSSPDTKLLTQREAWVSVSEKDSGNNEVTTMHVDHDVREKTTSDTQKIIEDNSAKSSKALNQSDLPSSGGSVKKQGGNQTSELSPTSQALNQADLPSSAGIVALDEKMPGQPNKGDKVHHETKTQLSAATPSTPEELPKQKPSRRGGRGRKQRGHNETAGNVSEKQEEKALGDHPSKAKDGQQCHQKNYDDFKGAALKASPKKPKGERSEGKQGASQNLGRGAESRPRQVPKQKDSPTSGKDSDKKGAEGNRQAAGTSDPNNSPGDSSKGGKGGTPNRGRRRQRSRSGTKSGGPGGDKGDSRNRSNSTPEKRPSKNS